MRRLLPSPVLSCALFLVSLGLGQSVAPASVLLAAVLAVLAPSLTRALRPTPVRMRRPLACARLLGRVVLDSLRSNLVVLLALVRTRTFASAFVRIPLEVRDANALAALAAIVTATPGTAWAELAPDRSALLIHVLALEDEEALVATIKHRYERPLMEIFE